MLTHFYKLAGIYCLLSLSIVSVMCTSSSTEESELAEVYLSLREMALTNAAEIEPKKGVHSMLMEFYAGGELVSLMMAADGSASLYFGNGGGQIGMGELPEIREKVFDTIEEAGKYIDKMEATNEYPIPKKRKTRFYLVTESGVQTVEVADIALVSERSDFSPLFTQCHRVMGAMRQAEESGQFQE